MEWRDEIKRHGYLKTLSDAAQRALSKGTGLRLFHCLIIPGKTVRESSPSVPPALSCRFLEMEEVLRLLEPQEMTMTPEFVGEAFGKGDRCFGVLDRERLIHYCWFATSPTYVMDGLEFRFPSGAVYLYNGFTNREYRGRNIGPESMLIGASRYIDHGCHSGVALVAANNLNSLMAVKKMGFQKIGGFAYSSHLPSLAFRSPGCSRHGLSLRNVDDR